MSHATRHFTVVSNADGSNAHAVSYFGDKVNQDVLCRGFNPVTPRLGRRVVVKDVGCYDGVATYQGDLCPVCHEVADSIAATERAFALRDSLQKALGEGQGITLSHDDLAVVLSAYAPWEAKGLNVRPDGEALTGSDLD